MYPLRKMLGKKCQGVTSVKSMYHLERSVKHNAIQNKLVEIMWGGYGDEQQEPWDYEVVMAMNNWNLIAAFGLGTVTIVLLLASEILFFHFTFLLPAVLSLYDPLRLKMGTL
jgi:hypothetical protein